MNMIANAIDTTIIFHINQLTSIGKACGCMRSRAAKRAGRCAPGPTNRTRNPRYCPQGGIVDILKGAKGA